MSDHQLRVSKIRSGTVIDHVTGGQALNVLAILGIDGSGGESMSIGMNVPSDRLGRKDIVKVEDRELSQSEVDVLSLIAPEATINIVRDYEVVDKLRVERPQRVVGVLSCPNRNCISNANEPVESKFDVVDEGAPGRRTERSPPDDGEAGDGADGGSSGAKRGDGVRCVYCGTIVREDIADHLSVA